MEPLSNLPENLPPADSGQAGQVFIPGGQLAAPPAPAPADSPAERPVAVASPLALANQAILPSVIPAKDPFTKPPKRAIYKSPIMIAAAAVLVLAGGSAAAYFGYYVPNRPANIWKSALTNTGKGYDKLSQYAVTQFESKNSGIKLDGKFKTTGVLAADGTFSGSTDNNNGEFTGTLSAGGLKIDGDIRLIKSSASAPDVYFKVNGLQGIGDLLGGFGVSQQYTSSLNSLNNKWYFIDHSLFNQLSGSDSSSLQVTSDDIKSVLQAVGSAGKQNIFTNDNSKMAFTVQQNVGKEKRDGRSVYHFVAAVNKENFNNYINALCENLKNSNLKKFFNNDNQKTATAIGCSTATAAVNNFDTIRTADVWVDMRTKLIHAVRITDPKAKTNYFEIGQDYQGGSKFPFSLKMHSQDQYTADDSNINLTLDTKLNALSFGGEAKETGRQGSGNFDASFQLNLSKNSSRVNVQKPDNAENIIQLLNDLGIGQVYQGIQSSAKDTERQTDINAMQGQIEAFYADNGYYPTLANINDTAWRTKNFAGLDSEALKDPAGAAAKLAVSPAAHVYSYQPAPAGCDDIKVQCTDYTLTATLDSGGTYVKQSLNTDYNGYQTNIN